MPTELNPKNAFGELLLDLIDAQYEGDYAAGVQALIEATGLTNEEVEAIINGDTVVDDENLLAAIIQAFPGADDDDLEVIVNVATSVDAEDRDALLDSIEGAEAEGEMVEEGVEEEDPELAAASYGYNTYNTANFGYNNMENQRLAHLEQKLANFEYASAISNKLKQLDFMASQAVANEALPRSYKTMLVGNFSSDNERLARFSQIAAENGVDVPTMLFATEFALGLLSDAADFVEFKDYSLSDEDVAVANFSASLDSVVKDDVSAIFADSLLGVN